MFILEVIPVKRAIGKENLSYFSKENVPPGTIVSVPLRSKSSDAVVIKSTPLRDEKLSIKSKSFALKKITKIKGAIFRSDFLDAVKDVSRFYACTSGSLLSQLTPSPILLNAHKAVAVSREKDASRVKPDDGIITEHLILQAESDDRYATYKSLIREEFAKNKSVFCCLPTTASVKKAYSILEKGISEYSYFFHAGLSPKETLQKWNEATSQAHPVLIVATGSFLSIPRTDCSLIIIEQESSRHYKMQSRPFADIRHFAEKLSDKIGARVLFGDIALRVETIWRFREGELHGAVPPKFKYLSSANEILIDMKEAPKTLPSQIKTKKEKKVEFIILGDAIKSLIKKTKDTQEHMLIFAARRGLSPTTVCNDCGEIVKCGNCATPTVLHRSGSKTIYLCHRCNNAESSERRCEYCESWKLTALGIGIETVGDELHRFYPDIKVFRIDSDTIKSEKGVAAEVEKWQNNPGSILLTTELALPYIEKAENVAVVSIDALFSVPDFRINEKVLGLVLHLRTIAIKNFLVQTRQPEQSAIRAGISGNLLDFYRAETEEREQFDYPPFSQFIKISLVGEKAVISKEMKEIEPLFAGYEFDIFPALSGSVKGKSVMHALLRLKRLEWPDESLLQRLNSLPAKFSIKVDPESLL